MGEIVAVVLIYFFAWCHVDSDQLPACASALCWKI